MITAYCSNCTSVEIRDLSHATSFPGDVVWIDMIEPTRDEELYVEKVLGIEVPTRDDLKDIEPSARLYVENDAVFMTGSLLWKADTEAPTLTDVAFILAGNRLVTIRYAHPKSFALFIAALHRLPENWRSGAALLAKLLETIVDRTAEILEVSILRLDILSMHVFGDRAKKTRKPSNYLEEKLRDIAGHHRMISKVRDSLGSLSRLLTFFHTIPAIQQDREAKELCRTVSRDIQSLSEHASFVAGNITFLLDASLGLINIEQNSIIKIFSIASVVFLPPTLVASVYGMNFQVMPELAWAAGYPYSLALMVVSAVIPFFFFRWKGWL
ncbi:MULTISPECIES: magnesium transporter CorA family protein [unclassified Rhizobium]|uniref:magnesium transporter CorA family protein n=1 Tax=unclassified Rhizobium TaxID=2613769 RepID=UPI001A9827D5|nr:MULTISPECIES: magnesium transporter CorA family protein [unclassified Rhizobium]MBX5161306.1 magnesium transporter CorA family protein [Rhizobium sp. NZLR8]MBX5161911.1 magnesium transporter CorA family protein [Rhizobium sp. NZLR4b]MBX5173748.1 magnesium transporter CorA family protein [Rhizobium sp. NZLR1b]MBX5181064.1 magnesium transporter CorA family protein [Rhizobium sp. NZLR5]MBX5199192.1 magnesium transporter CorA family protein [Rhizobium sp. NZLR10]